MCWLTVLKGFHDIYRLFYEESNAIDPYKNVNMWGYMHVMDGTYIDALLPYSRMLSKKKLESKTE